MSDNLKKLRIFVASPSDVASERAKLQTVVDSLKPTADGHGLILEVVDWHAVVPDAGRPQQIIFDQLKPTSWDIFIGILWHRFGTPPGVKDKTSKDYLSGTEEEFKTAYELYKQHGKPRIVFYRCLRALPFDVDTDQLKNVREFFKLLEDVKGYYTTLYNEFDTIESFEKLVLHNLQKLLVEYSEDSITPITPEGKQVMAPKIQNNTHLPFGDQRTSPWYGKDIISVKQFGREDLEYIFAVSHEMHNMVDHIGTFDLLKGKILANLFYEPSTRTSSSFTAAMERLGGSVIPINEVKYSSVSKGESLADTVRTLECYADVIVLRHPEVGSASIAARAARKPVINAGDGTGEHPTQALLDAFTIREEIGHPSTSLGAGFDGLTVTLLGDLKHGRTVHSLARLLSLYKVKLNYVSPDILRMPAELIEELNAKKIEQTEYANLDACLPQTDVLYVTRVQKERFADEATYESVKGAYVIDPKVMKAAKERMIVMHPLPRVGEISPEFDDDPRAAYFRQMEYGLYVRMALLAMVLGKA